MVTGLWNLIVDGPLPASFNMAVDQTLLDHLSNPFCTPSTYLRFYQWECPTLSLGISQKAERVVDLDYCKSQGIELVRRITGGKAVLHDKEITYSVISNDSKFFPSKDIKATYQAIAAALETGFRAMGLETTLAAEAPSRSLGSTHSSSCFAAANHFEILHQGKKLVGSAQRRTRSAFLQHGSILLNIDAERWSRALRPHQTTEVWSRVTSLSVCLGCVPDVRSVIRKLVFGFGKSFEVDFNEVRLDGRLRDRALELSDSKYSILEWDESPKMA